MGCALSEYVVPYFITGHGVISYVGNEIPRSAWVSANVGIHPAVELGLSPMRYFHTYSPSPNYTQVACDFYFCLGTYDEGMGCGGS